MYVTCTNKSTLNVELYIIHRSFLELWNTVWYVTQNRADEPLIGRPTLEALGVNTRKIIDADMEKVDTSLNMNHIID